MNSMTGYGRGETKSKGVLITVELNSVNRKQAEVSLSLPPGMDSIESNLREMILASVSRGRVKARIELQYTVGEFVTAPPINISKAQAYCRKFNLLAKSLGIPNDLSLETLLRQPGITESAEHDSGKFRTPVKRALFQALEALQAMRAYEGAALERDLAKRLAKLRGIAKRVSKRAPMILKYHRARLIKRLKQAGIERPFAEDERLLREIVYYADRMDITEELIRLDSHFDQMEKCLASKRPVGRKLDFLAQEMFREINTIGSKANDAPLSTEVVALKAELEKIREQVQNIE